MTGEVNPNLLGPVQGANLQPVIPSIGEEQQTIAQDSIQASDQIAAAIYLYSSAMPILPPPDYDLSVDLKTAVASGLTADMVSNLFETMSQSNREIIDDMLDAWSKQIAEQDRLTKEWLASPQYQNFLEVRFPDQKPESISKLQISLSETQRAGVSAVSDYAKSDPDAVNIGFMVGSLVVGAGMTFDFTPAVNSSDAPPSIGGGPSVVSEAMPSFQNVITDPNMVAQLGFLGGMIAAGALNSAALVSIFATVEKGGKPESAKMIREFANRILNLVKDPSFNAHILFRIVDHLPGAKLMSLREKMQMVAIVKAILLATALAAMYKGETKWLGEEVKNLLQGDLSGFFKGGQDVDRQLRISLGMELQATYAELSPDQRIRLIDALSNYFKSQPSLKQLSNVGNTFENVAAHISNKEIQG